MDKMEDSKELLSVEGLKTYFHNYEGLLKAVDDISFSIRKGRTLGVVGESGCGKSVAALSIMNLLPKKKGRIAGGHVYYHKNDGKRIDLTSLKSDSKEMWSIRGGEIAMIFQEPMTSLNPVYTIGSQIIEAIRYHQDVSKKKAREKAINLIGRVGIPAPHQRFDEYSFELSGGMRQRAMIAMALSCNPTMLIADEPTTALDVTVEAQILNLIKDLQQEFKMSLMIITHDLGVIGEMSEKVIVMYMGKIVEQALVDDIFYNTKHPYTRALLKSLPVIGWNRRLTPIGGSVPNPYLLPKHCAFKPRCSDAMEACNNRTPSLIKVGDEHYVSCLLYQRDGVS